MSRGNRMANRCFTLFPLEFGPVNLFCLHFQLQSASTLSPYGPTGRLRGSKEYSFGRDIHGSRADPSIYY